MTIKKNNHSENLSLLKKIVEIMNKDNLSELEYEYQDVKIKLSNKITNNLQNNYPEANRPIDKKMTEKKDQEFSNNHPGAVNSPMVGTAYASSEPGKEPFVKMNSLVKKGDTLMIIEAMKVMNTITAPKSGKVVFIGFSDNQPVEYNQILLIIE